MKINRKQYKKLMKNGGGKFKNLACITTIIEEAPADIKQGSSLNLYVMKNGVLGNTVFGMKLYFKFENIEDATLKGNRLILDVNEGTKGKYVFKGSIIPLQLKKVYENILKLSGIEYKEPIKGESFFTQLKEGLKEQDKQMQLEKEKIEELEKQKTPYCPKCHSTSIEYIDKTLEQRLTLGDNLADMNYLFGKGRVENGVLRCLNCGYSWKLKYKKKK